MKPNIDRVCDQACDSSFESLLDGPRFAHPERRLLFWNKRALKTGRLGGRHNSPAIIFCWQKLKIALSERQRVEPGECHEPRGNPGCPILTSRSLRRRMGLRTQSRACPERIR